MEFKSFPEVLNHFKDSQTCIEFLEQQRWAGKPICPFCDHDKVYKTNRGYKCANKECYKKFSVTVGTVFENSKIKLNLWFAAIYICTAHKKGISSLQLHRDLGITQKTAWFMLHRIREMFNQNAPYVLKGDVLVDETYVGGLAKNMHKDKRGKFESPLQNKTGVMGFMEDGQIKTLILENDQAWKLADIVRKNVHPDSTVITDAYPPYKNLKKSFKKHIRIDHAKSEYAKDGYSTNALEGAWSLLKRGIYGIYHSVSAKHLHRYCDEYAYRYNTRKVNDRERFIVSLTKVDGRLTYKNLTKKP